MLLGYIVNSVNMQVRIFMLTMSGEAIRRFATFPTFGTFGMVHVRLLWQVGCAGLKWSGCL
ncbi:hypothetical protein BWP03_00975 [Corynebacterium jeikeium]|nr:hypothetical protein BWP03_00975 [Corynebacterium jeikeium]